MKTIRLNEVLSKINGGTKVFVVTSTPSVVEALESMDSQNLSILTEDVLLEYINKEILDSLVTRTVILDPEVGLTTLKTFETLESKGYEVFLLLRESKTIKELVDFTTNQVSNEVKLIRPSDVYQNYNIECDCAKAVTGSNAFQYALSEIKRLSGYPNVALIEDFPSLFHTYYGKSRVYCTGSCSSKGVSSSADAQLSEEFSEIEKLLFNEGTLLVYNAYADAFRRFPRVDITSRDEDGKLLNKSLRKRTHTVIDMLDSILSRFDTLLTFEEAYYVPATLVNFYKTVYKETDSTTNTLENYILSLKGGYLDRVYDMFITYNLVNLPIKG